MAKRLTGSKGEPRSEEQQELIKELRGRFGSEPLNDAMLRRFLITRSWKIDGAAAMLQSHLKWRTENLPVSVEEVQPILDKRKFVLLGSGADGRPVFALNFSQLLQVEWREAGQMEKHVRAAVYCAERMIAGMPEGVEEWVAIVNCNGIRAPPAAYMAEFTKVMKANYPERAHKIVMYPVPKIIVTLVKTMMSIIPEKTREKVSFTSSLEGVCRETGLSMDQLPEEMAGTPADLEVLKGATAIETSAGKVAVHRESLSAGEFVKWEYRVIEHSVNFTMRFVAAPLEVAQAGSASPSAPASSKSPGSATTTKAAVAGAGYNVIQLEKSQEASDTFSSDQPGTLEFSFDNSFSYLRGKRIVLSLARSAKE